MPPGHKDVCPVCLKVANTKPPTNAFWLDVRPRGRTRVLRQPNENSHGLSSSHSYRSTHRKHIFESQCHLLAFEMFHLHLPRHCSPGYVMFANWSVKERVPGNVREDITDHLRPSMRLCDSNARFVHDFGQDCIRKRTSLHHETWGYASTITL